MSVNKLTSEQTRFVANYLQIMSEYKSLSLKHIKNLYPEFIQWWAKHKDNEFVDIGLFQAFHIFEAGYICHQVEANSQ